jgi:hypothetical protein
MRQAWWLQRASSLEKPYKDRSSGKEIKQLEEVQSCEREWLQRHDLAQELAWRLTRCHELRHSQEQKEKERLQKDIKRLLPQTVDITESISEMQDIGLPSILEVLQEGIGVKRANRPSTLTAGMREEPFRERFTSLRYQHRMHPEIAEFSRKVIYKEKALETANTISERESQINWDFGDFGNRRVWQPINGREEGGINQDEIKAMESVLHDFLRWAREKGKPKRERPPVWEVACLCFYQKQEQAISKMLGKVTGETDRRTRFEVLDAHVEIVCGTVDRFQGREADLVLLSMRNTRRIGFLDSPNRLNVAVTRAREQMMIFGHYDYFTKCDVSELKELAKQTKRWEPVEKRSKR